MKILKALLLNLYAWPAGVFLFLLARFLHSTCRFELHGKEHLLRSPNHIFATWHRNNLPFFITFLNLRSFVWMVHPAAYMQPIYFFLKMSGAKKLIMGSSGHEGRKAADELVVYLKKGYSTQFAPDGPGVISGKARKGILHIAAQSKVPIIPITVESSHHWQMNWTWDKKMLPLPFSKIKIFFGSELRIDQVNNEALWILESRLNGAEKSVAMLYPVRTSQSKA